MKEDKYLYVNVSYEFKDILYIDEVKNFMRIIYNIQKDWYNCFLTYQNLKRNTLNQVFPEDKNMIWFPWLTSKNMENTKKEVEADDEEIFRVVPNVDFIYQHNSIANYQNALLFKVNISYDLWGW